MPVGSPIESAPQARWSSHRLPGLQHGYLGPSTDPATSTRDSSTDTDTDTDSDSDSDTDTDSDGTNRTGRERPADGHGEVDS